MPRNSIQTVSLLIDAFQAGLAAGDPAAGFDTDHIAADAECVPVPEFPGPSSYRGREGFADFMAYWTEGFEDWALEVEKLSEADSGRVIALLRQTGTGKESGVPVEMEFTMVFDLIDGKVVRMRNFLDSGQASAAAEGATDPPQ